MASLSFSSFSMDIRSRNFRPAELELAENYMKYRQSFHYMTEMHPSMSPRHVVNAVDDYIAKECWDVVDPDDHYRKKIATVEALSDANMEKAIRIQSRVHNATLKQRLKYLLTGEL